MTDDRRPPRLSLAASQTSEDLALSHAANELHWAINDFAANFLRVIRGAGQIHDIPNHLSTLQQAIDQEAFRNNPSRLFAEMEFALRDGVPYADEMFDDFLLAQNTMVKGALQMVASHFVGQNTQFSKGRSELMEGMMEAEKIRAANRKRTHHRQPTPQEVEAIFSAKRAKADSRES